MKEDKKTRIKLNPLPELVEDIGQAIINLEGDDWKLCLNVESLESSNGELEWNSVQVPSQVEAGDKAYAYKKLLYIPQEWDGKRIFLRFDGVNCLARVFIDGKFLMSHYGGFVSWDCDITDFVGAGGRHQLVVGVMDKPQELATFQKGGIIRDVFMYALPKVFLSRLQIETTFINHYTDAFLDIELCVSGGGAVIELLLTSPDVMEQTLGTVSMDAEMDVTCRFQIDNPRKWDSEHPYLYTLTAVLKQGDAVAELVRKRIGFRQIEKRGKQIFLNGDVLKLRGINRHDIHPLMGRSITGEIAEEDVRLLKEANINFIRTSHYPPRPDFLDYCDQYGIYVEDETAIAFLGYATDLTQDDPAYSNSYLHQFAELIERDKSHPCVIIWSLANESYWGENHGLCLKHVRAEDPGRLTVFSYPATQKEDDEITDLWSTHYGNWDSKLDDMTECFRRTYYGGSALPVIHDESTHIPCYGWSSLKRDPGIRDFWGETIKRFWERIWETDGAIGCAVWAGIDEVVVKNGIPQGPQWGILDGWRRKKPEYWHIRKGYSPIVIDKQPRAEGIGVAISLYNRFNHTNLNEITVSWRLGQKSGCLNGPDVSPRKEGVLYIPVSYAPDEALMLSFSDSYGFCVEERLFRLGGNQITLPRLSGKAPELEYTENDIHIKGKDFHILFSRETGLIKCGYVKDEEVITGGPAFHLTGLDLEPWSLKEMDVQRRKGYVLINTDGAYGQIGVHFTIRIDDEGLMEITYTVTDMPYPSPRKIAITSSVISHQGGYDEVGVSFQISKELHNLSWKRNGIWDVYPDWHIGRLTGDTEKYNQNHTEVPDQMPNEEWKQDESDWALFGKYEFGHRGTRDFSSMKANIEWAALSNNDIEFSALSDTKDSVRMELMMDGGHRISDRNSDIIYHGSWFHKDNRHHSFDGTETWSKEAGDSCMLAFKGTGIVWYSSLDRICGTANVYIDGILAEEEIDLGSSRIGKDPRGYQKSYRYPVFAAQNLAMGNHTIEVVGTGKRGKNSFNSYVNIDSFLILDGLEHGDTKFIVNSEYNYPEISWADYCKPPVCVASGYTKTVYVKMGRKLLTSCDTPLE